MLRFSLKSVNSNLQTGSDFRLLASASPECKSGQKSCSVFQPLMSVNSTWSTMLISTKNISTFFKNSKNLG